MPARMGVSVSRTRGFLCRATTASVSGWASTISADGLRDVRLRLAPVFAPVRGDEQHPARVGQDLPDGRVIGDVVARGGHEQGVNHGVAGQDDGLIRDPSTRRLSAASGVGGKCSVVSRVVSSRFISSGNGS